MLSSESNSISSYNAASKLVYDFTGYQGAKVVVTGGLGFVGSNVVKRLDSAGARVTVLDDGFTGKLENIAGTENVDVIHGSVTNPADVAQALKGAEYVFHMACRNIIVSTREPYQDCQVNTVGTVNVLLEARETGVRRVVYTSSASIYGNSEHYPAREEDAPRLYSPYAASKYAGEAFCSGYYESFHLPVVVLRYSNVYGTMQRPDNPYCGVVSRFMQAALDGQSLLVFGDGGQTRDFTYIDDTVTATLLAGMSNRSDGQVYNVATGREVSVNELAQMVARVSGVRCVIEQIPRRDIDTVRRRVLSTERIRHDLQWSAHVSIEEGLKRTFEWIRAQH